MSYQRVKCPKGHVFMANVFGKGVRLTCEECANHAQLVSEAAVDESTRIAATDAQIAAEPFLHDGSEVKFPNGIQGPAGLD